MEIKNKSGQVTIFVVVGIVIVVGLLIFLFLMNDGVSSFIPGSAEPVPGLQSCVKDAIEGSITRIYQNGGEIDPQFTVSYLGEEYNYLCHSGDYYSRCYNLHPMLELQIERRLKEDTLDSVQGCFDSLREDLEGRGFSVTGGSTEYFINLVTGGIEVDLKKDITASKADTTEVYSDFSFEIVSPLYDLVRVTKNIVESESLFCTFEANGYMIFYPEFDIKVARFDNDRFYKVAHRDSGEEFKFAVRSCPSSAGL